MLKAFSTSDSASGQGLSGQQVGSGQTEEFADDLLRKREYPVYDEDERDSKVEASKSLSPITHFP